jgi:hypothetical protein
MGIRVDLDMKGGLETVLGDCFGFELTIGKFRKYNRLFQNAFGLILD